MFKQEIQNKILDLFQKVGTILSVDDIAGYYMNDIKETSIKTEILDLIVQNKLILTNENKVKLKSGEAIFEGKNNTKCDCTKAIFEEGMWQKIIKNNAYLDTTSKNKVCKKCGHIRGQHCNSGNDLSIECMVESCPCMHFVEQIKTEKGDWNIPIDNPIKDEVIKTQNGFDGYFYYLKDVPLARIEVRAEVGGHGQLYSIIMPTMHSQIGSNTEMRNVLKVLNQIFKDYNCGIRIIKGDIKDI